MRRARPSAASCRAAVRRITSGSRRQAVHAGRRPVWICSAARAPSSALPRHSPHPSRLRAGILLSTGGEAGKSRAKKTAPGAEGGCAPRGEGMNGREEESVACRPLAIASARCPGHPAASRPTGSMPCWVIFRSAFRGTLSPFASQAACQLRAGSRLRPCRRGRRAGGEPVRLAWRAGGRDGGEGFTGRSVKIAGNCDGSPVRTPRTPAARRGCTSLSPLFSLPESRARCAGRLRRRHAKCPLPAR